MARFDVLPSGGMDVWFERSAHHGSGYPGTRFTRCTSTKVQLLTPEALRARRCWASHADCEQGITMLVCTPCPRREWQHE